MKIIDARSGKEIHVGDSVEYPGAPPGVVNDVGFKLLSADVGVLSAKVRLRWQDGREIVVECPVRYTHPEFPFQKVVFIPT